MKSIPSPKLLRTVFIGVFPLLTMAAWLCAQGHDYQTSFQNARALLNQKRYDQALVQAQWAIAADGSQWGGYYVAGTALVGLQRQDNAITYFQAALAHAPEQAKPIINAAIASCRQISANESQAPAGAQAYSPQYSQAEPNSQPPAAAPEPAASKQNSIVIDSCVEAVRGPRDDRPGTLTLGSNVEWHDTKNSSHDYSAPANQVTKFHPGFYDRSQGRTNKELTQQKMFILRGERSGFGGVSFDVNGKNKLLWCDNEDLATIFRYFQAHGFYQDVAIIQ